MVAITPEANEPRDIGTDTTPGAHSTAVGPLIDVRPATSARMSRQAVRDTTPELLLRRELHRLGLRYRVDHSLPGMPQRRADILFSRAKVAVFVDGCFWHGCPEHKTSPANNGAWWAAKLARNVDRDRETDGHLSSLGWIVLRVWEHEAMEQAATDIGRIIRSRTDPTSRRDNGRGSTRPRSLTSGSACD